MKRIALLMAVAAAFFLTGPVCGESGRFLDSAGNVREQPDAKGKLLFTSQAGDEFTVIERLGAKWVRVQLKDGRSGWTNVINVKFDPVAAVEKASDVAAPGKPAITNLAPPTKDTNAAGSGELLAENQRLKDEVARLEQEKMLIESSSTQSQFVIEKLKEELRKMTEQKEQLAAENRQLKNK
ncbi:MAG TPA: SH3 domain-containing protein [Candidatus Rifleibacterium sp.]|nr:SH3 domain-containing protein [Candidatus Rifleibacterium sp.]HPT45582.1 SH3 domain-containing protein [Candidatus Rifleibacterium sp.]